MQGLTEEDHSKEHFFKEDVLFAATNGHNELVWAQPYSLVQLDRCVNPRG